MHEAGALGTDATATRDALLARQQSPGPVQPDAADTRTLQDVAADRLGRDLHTSNRPWTGNAVNGVLDAKTFRQAVLKWARGYSMKYRHAPGPKPTVAEARQALRRWSTSYWTRSPLAARL
jgi:hypothetical protein